MRNIQGNIWHKMSQSTFPSGSVSLNQIETPLTYTDIVCQIYKIWLLSIQRYIYTQRYMQSKSNSNMRVRSTSKFSLFQINMLEERFEKNNYLSGKERDQLARKIDLTPRQVQVWFGNRRIKVKKLKTKEITRRTVDSTSHSKYTTLPRTSTPNLTNDRDVAPSS